MAYNLLIIFFFLTFVFENKILKNKFINTFLLSSVFIFIAIFFGLRFQVGPDWVQMYTYLESTKNFKFIDIFSQREAIDILIMKFSYIIGNNLIFYFFVIFIFFHSLLFYVFYTDKKNFWFYLCFSLPTFYIFLSVNSPRQSLTIAILLLFIFCFEKNKNIIFPFLLGLLSALIHNSSVIILPLYIICLSFHYRHQIIKINKNYLTIIFISIFLCIFVFIYQFLPLILYYFKTSYLLLSFKSDGFYFRYVYLFIFFFMGLFLFFNNDDSKYKLLFSLFLIIFVFTLTLSLFSSTVADRILYFCYPFTVYIAYKYLLIIDNFRYKSHIKFFLIIYNYLFYFIWTFYSTVYNLWSPYRNLINENFF